MCVSVAAKLSLPMAPKLVKDTSFVRKVACLVEA